MTLSPERGGLDDKHRTARNSAAGGIQPLSNSPNCIHCMYNFPVLATRTTCAFMLWWIRQMFFQFNEHITPTASASSQILGSIVEPCMLN